MRARLLVLLPGLMLMAFGKTVLLEHVKLQWKPTSELRLGAMQMSPAVIQFETFQDVRDNKEAIGENDEDDKPKPVTTTDDVGAFVSKGEVKQFFVRETSTYKTEVAVHLTVVGAAGNTLWSGVASGDASRFGRSYNLENYYEGLSDALVNTVSSMLRSAEFQKALSGN